MNHIDAILNFMYIPVEKAPPEFMKRYHAIMNGQEKLDTVAKLKDFWLFAVEQGWKSYEMREYIAKLVFEISPYNELIRGTGASDIFNAYNYFESLQFIGESMDENMSDEELADQAWWHLEQAVKQV